MTGEAKVLVGKPPATHCRPWEESNDYLCPIDRDHSDMVKFSANDNNYDIVLVTLQGMVARAASEERCMPQKDIMGHASGGVHVGYQDAPEVSSVVRKRSSSWTSVQPPLKKQAFDPI